MKKEEGKGKGKEWGWRRKGIVKEQGRKGEGREVERKGKRMGTDERKEEGRNGGGKGRKREGMRKSMRRNGVLRKGKERQTNNWK